MLSQAFEIKVGLLGYVSVGKTTGLNALFQGKFSEVSMKRTTAGVNFFRVSSLTKAPKRTRKPGAPEDNSMDWQDIDDATANLAESSESSSYIDADDTLKETTTDNAKLRESNELQERTFDIELDQHLLQDMRSDTRLVIVDIPGINEAGTSKLYLDYVGKTWDTYDAMIVVMDASVGVNTDEQVNLLNFVKKNLDEKKQVPIIVVCNKVDDPDDEELMCLVKEARDEVEKIFSVTDRAKALDAITTGKTNTFNGKLSPAFLPASFENAFVYRSASRLQLSELNRLDKAYIDKIGHEEVGKYKWKKLPNKKRYELVHQIVSDPAQYKERLESSNFDTLLKLLQYFLGGKKTQESIIEKQLEVALTKMTVEDGITVQLTSVFDRAAALGKDTSDLEGRFWRLYSKCRKESFNKFYGDPTCITEMHAPMKELIAYAQGLYKKLARGNSGAAEEDLTKIIDAMKHLIRQQINVVIEKQQKWKPVQFTSATVSSWDQLSLKDWSTIISFILMLSHRKIFCESFGQEIAELEWMVRTGYFTKPEDFCFRCNMIPNPNQYSYNYGKLKCRSCGGVNPIAQSHENMKGTYTFGVFTPSNKEAYDTVVHIKVPDSISDPSHWGNLSWLFCEFMDSLEA